MKQVSLAASILSLIFLFSFNGKPAGTIQDDVLKYTNDFRKANKLEALEINADMNEIAQKHSQDMANGKVSFGHNGFSQRTEQIKKKMKKCGAFAENVAYGATTGKDAVELWETSEGHRKNLLGPYKYIGIGFARSKTGQTFFTQIFASE